MCFDMNEIKYILGFDNKYSINEYGIIISYSKRHFGKEVKQVIEKCGYVRVWLSKNNSQKKYLVHRIIAEMFIPNPENKPTVNHINGIKSDNRIENRQVKYERQV